MRPKLYLITFDAPGHERRQYTETRRKSNVVLPATIYRAVDKILMDLGAFFKPMHQVRLLLTYESATTIRDRLRRITRDCPLMIVQPDEAGWALTQPNPELLKKAARWLRRDFTQAELVKANPLL